MSRICDEARDNLCSMAISGKEAFRIIRLAAQRCELELVSVSVHVSQDVFVCSFSNGWYAEIPGSLVSCGDERCVIAVAEELIGQCDRRASIYPIGGVFNGWWGDYIMTQPVQESCDSALRLRERAAAHWAALEKEWVDFRVEVSKLLVAECVRQKELVDSFEREQREDAAVFMAGEDRARASELWSAQLRSKVQASRREQLERERLQVVLELDLD